MVNFARRPGLTLAETLLGLAVGAVVATGAVYLIQSRQLDVLDNATALQLSQLEGAAEQYVRDNYTTLAVGTGITITPGGTDANSVAFQTYLPPRYGNNAYRQTWRVATRLVPATAPATGNQLQMLVVTGSDPTHAGRTLEPFRVGHVVGLMGPKAGFFTTIGGAASIQGAYGGWQLTNLSGFNFGSLTTGSLAAYVSIDNGMVFSDWLSRVQVPGHPELNQMQTDIDVNQHNLYNANSVTIGKPGATSQSTIANDANNGLTLTSRDNNPITLQGSDVYAGTPTDNNADGSAVVRSNGVSMKDPTQVVFSQWTHTNTNGSTRSANLYDFLSGYHGVANWAADSGQSVLKPVCDHGGIPQILTTVHAFEGGVTQDSTNGALTPQRVLPMRVHANDSNPGGTTGTWEILVEYLNPYPQCGGGANVWSQSVIQPNPAGAGCSVVSSRPGFVIAQTFCYYAPIDTPTNASVVIPTTP